MASATARLTQGSIFKTLAGLALPIMASSFLSTAYNITDMAWVGMLGSSAVAGVGMGGMFVWLSSGLSMVPRIGGQVHVGQALGRGDADAAQHYAAAALQLAALFGLVFGAVCFCFPRQLLSFFLLQDAATEAAACLYLKLVCSLSILSYLNLTLIGLYTAQGNSTTPLKANTVGLVLNMLLDPMLILGAGPFPRLEVLGASLATVLAQAVVLTMLLVMAEPDNLLRQCRPLRSFSSQYFRQIVQIGGPSALQNTLYCVISMIMTRRVSAFGDAAIAVFRVGGQIESVSWNTADGFGSAMNAFAAQNYGAGQIRRIRRGYRLSVVTLLIWGFLMAAAFFFLPEPISRVFFHEPEAIAVSVGYLTVLSLCEPFMCVEILTSSTMAGLGRTLLCSILSGTMTAARIPLAYLLSDTELGVTGVWWALTSTSVVKGIVFFAVFSVLIRRIQKDANEKS